MVRFSLEEDSVYHLGKFEGSCSLKLTVSLIRYTLGILKCTKTSSNTFGGGGMKREIARFVACCLVCQQVKAEYQRTAELLQPLPIPEWRWHNFTMDFVVGLPRSPRGKLYG